MNYPFSPALNTLKTFASQRKINFNPNKKLFFLGLIFTILAFPLSSQVDYFNVSGSWAGNDVNGNAVIKWNIQICAGTNGANDIWVSVPSIERDECTSGGVGIGDEDSPADDQVCGGSWNNPGGNCDVGMMNNPEPGDWDNYRPANYKTTGHLAEAAFLCPNTCATYSWTTFSKDYDSNSSDYDHYTVASYQIGSAPSNFNCPGDGHNDCTNGNTNCMAACPECQNAVDCADVATNNYEQVLGLAHELVDGPNLHLEGYFDMTWQYTVCHHGESDYYTDFDTTNPEGPAGGVAFDVTPANVCNIEVRSNLISELQNIGAVVDTITLSSHSGGTYLDPNPNWDGLSSGNNILTVPTSNLDPGIKETITGGAAGESCGPTNMTIATCSQPFCDTIDVYITWRPTSSSAMFNNGGNPSLSGCRDYWHTPILLGTYGECATPGGSTTTCQDTGSANGDDCNPPNEVTTSRTDHRPSQGNLPSAYRNHPNFLKPDPEYGDGPSCHANGGGGSNSSSTCSAGPAEDCDGSVIEMCYLNSIIIDKNTLSVVPSPNLNPNNYDVTYEIIVTNDGDSTQNVNHLLTDNLAATFGAGEGVAYLTPFVSPPTLDLSVVPAPGRTDQGFPTLNPGFNGDSDTELIDQTTPLVPPYNDASPQTTGVVEPGESFRITFTVRVNRDVVGTVNHDNTSTVNATDPNGIYPLNSTDASPAELPTFDLALNKVTEQSGPAAPGQLVAFKIRFFNQGEGTINQVKICDYIPEGLQYEQPFNLGWSESNGTACYTWNGSLASGEKDSIQINLRVLGNYTLPSSYTNYAEICQIIDDFGVDRSTQDEDSMPGSNGAGENAVAAGDPADNDITSTDKGGEEDDHDPAVVTYVDLALTKALAPGEMSPFRYGDPIVFEFTIANQGTACAHDIEITDFVPEGYDFPMPQGTWTWDMITRKAKMTYPGNLCPGDAPVVVPVTMILRPSNTPDPHVNYGEISGALDDNNMPVSDIDSNLDDQPGDGGGVPDGNTDNVIDGNGTGGQGQDDPNLDEDDSDPAWVQIVDLALQKTITSSPPYAYGSPIDFQIKVINQGDIPVQNVVVNDYIPDGYTFMAADNSDFTMPGPTATITNIMNPGDEVDLTLTLRLSQGTDSNSWDNYAEIASMRDTLNNDISGFDADSNPGSDAGHENSVMPGDPDDDNVDGWYIWDASDEDDHDPARPEVVDVALTKTTAATGPFSYGQNITFDINVTNQGNDPLYQIDVIDYIPDGYDYDPTNFPTWNYDIFSHRAVTTISGPLDPGMTTTVPIRLIVRHTFDAATGYDNYAEVYDMEDAMGNSIIGADIDSQGDTNDGNDIGGNPWTPEDDHILDDGNDFNMDGITDEDDHDPERIEIFDLALQKTIVTPAPYYYGQTVEFNIQVCNQGNIGAKNITVNDYLPAGYGFSFGNNPTWMGTVANPIFNTGSTDTLHVDACIDIPLFLTVLMTGGGEKDWINYAEIASADNENDENRDDWDIDSNPGLNTPAENDVEPGDPADNDMESTDKGGEEDDHDPAGIEIFDLAVQMLDDTDVLAAYGDPVTFPIDVTNQGSITSAGFTVTNYIPDGYIFNGADNMGWTQNLDGTVSYIYPSDIVPGETVPLTLVLETRPTKEPNGWVNVIEISSDNSVHPTVIDDIDSNPDNNPDNDAGGAVETPSDDTVNGVGIDQFGMPTDIPGSTDPATDEDDADPETIIVYDMALYKQMVTQGPYQYGEVHEFDICVVNQGSEIMTNVDIMDYVPNGYSFDPNENMGVTWTPVAGGVTTTIAGPFNPCDTICVSLFLTFEQTTGGDKDWINYAEIIEMDGPQGPVDDVDSTPGSNGPGETDVLPNDPNDDNTTSTDKGGEEDDHDPAGPAVFDLAVQMIDDTDILAAYGDPVTFPIEVTNQGNVTSNGFTVTNYVPSGYVFDEDDNMGWILNMDGTVSYTYPADVVPGEIVSLTLILEAIPTKEENGWVNVIEISADNSANPLAPTDIDSNPDTNPDNDSGGAVETASDDTINGVGIDKFGNPTDVPGSTDPTTDEDDADPETIRVFDLALYKQVVTPAPYSYGSVIDFDVCVINQGSEIVSNVTISDHIPPGYALAPGNIGWYPDGPGIVSYDLNMDMMACDTICTTLSLILQMTNGGYRDWINYAEVKSFTDEIGMPVDDIDSNPNSNGPDELAVEPDDPEDDDVTSLDKGGEEDDHDPAGIDIFDLALRKTITSAGPSYSYGETAQYQIEVFNQGNIDATDIIVIDSLPCGLEYDTNSPVNMASGWNYNPATREATLTYTGVLTPGNSVTFLIESTVVPCYENEAFAWTNYADLDGWDDTDPSTPNPPEDIDSDPDGVNEGGEPNNPLEDDNVNGIGNCSNCQQTVTIPMDAMIPSIVDAVNINGGILPLPNYPYVLNDPVQAQAFFDDCVALGYVVGQMLVGNNVEITVFYPGNTNPGVSFENVSLNNGQAYDFVCHDCIGPVVDEDDHDPAQIEVFDLAIKKVAQDRGPFDIGEQVSFDITVYNQGNVTAQEIEITDHMRTGFTFPGNNPNWSQNGSTLTYVAPGPIIPGDSVVVTLNLITALDADPSEEDWFNYAEIETAEDLNEVERLDDADSTPGSNSPYENNVLPDDPWDNVTDGQGLLENEDEDDHDPAKVIVVGGLGDTVWKDLDGDGIQDGNEPGVPNVIVRLYDCNGIFVNSTATDGTGFYFFDNLVPGNYNVEFDLSALPPGCDFTYQDQGFDDEVDSDVGLDGIAPCTFISGGEYDSTFDAGLIPLASLGDFVWHDLDGDGVQDNNEPPIPGVHVHLYDGQGVYQSSTTTDINGNYLFDLLYPGEYYVQFESKDPEFMLTFPNKGFDDAKDSDVDDSNGPGTTTITTLSPGENDPDWDAGFYKCAKIGELVWYDINENDVWDVFENGINGILVRLMRLENGNWVEWDNMYTGHKPGTPSDDGYFKFCAPPGTYHIAINFPAMGLVPALAHVGNNENIDSDIDNANGFQTTATFTVFSEDEKCDIGAGYYPMAAVGNKVWNDINGDGLQSASEPIVQNVLVEAYDIYGTKVGEDITNANGEYNIDYLGKEDYYMKFTPPSGYVATTPNMGNDNVDSDIDGTNGYNTTDFISLNPGDEVTSVDAGLVLGVVPVEWKSFTAEHKGTHNHLTWITSSELNTSHFVVERRLENESTFTGIAQVDAAGISTEDRTYNYDDKDIDFKGTYYYRIKQIDINGSFGYTEVRNVRIEEDRTTSVTLYPNPAINKVQVTFNTVEDSKVHIAIWDIDGRLVMNNVINEVVSSGSYTKEIDISNFAGGVYNVKITLGGQVTNKSLIVVND